MSEPTVATLLRMPWTIQGPTPCSDFHANRWHEVRVKELPGFWVAGATADEAVNDYIPALTAYLESFSEAERATLVSPAVLWKWLTAFTNPATNGCTVGAFSVRLGGEGE